MNGFEERGLDEDAFGASSGKTGIASFDAFPKTKKTYLTRGRDSSGWTTLLILTCIYLSWSETSRWFAGTTTQTFSVEKGISHDMQINVDIVVRMYCKDLHVNMQDAAGDRTIAGDLLRKAPTQWEQWNDKKVHSLSGSDATHPGWEDMWDVHDQLGAAGKKKKFPKTPNVRGIPNACRIFGSLDGNKVQGDFHITARGHGYLEFGEHLEHKAFNFSHIINELSFGPYYPSLENPLDKTRATTDENFYKFQYYLSIVPTIYTDDASLLPLIESVNRKGKSHPAKSIFTGYHAIKTNQYAVTSQSHTVPENYVPGIFVKFDIEPIMLTVAEEWGGFFPLLIRLVNVISGVMVAGGWCWQIFDWGLEVWGRKQRNRGSNMGVLGSFGGKEKMAFD
ncbi:unnamed protein product [Periconia digitata]|uniref:Endoplasmic reticulum-Golgi intermediate compartment protein n=1 Tax=Periconia digitata TaxID=1303443 RepID=A0A9W4UAL2_9PLEO|nr:unnamed protein product [Periconia digitata]